MRLLQLATGPGEMIDLHPHVTVVTGLDAAGRQLLADAVTGLASGRAVRAEGLLEAHGVLFDLGPAELAMLDIDAADVAPVVTADDLPTLHHAPPTPERTAAEQALADARGALGRGQRARCHRPVRPGGGDDGGGAGPAGGRAGRGAGGDRAVSRRARRPARGRERAGPSPVGGAGRHRPGRGGGIARRGSRSRLRPRPRSRPVRPRPSTAPRSPLASTRRGARAIPTPVRRSGRRRRSWTRRRPRWPPSERRRSSRHKPRRRTAGRPVGACRSRDRGGGAEARRLRPG